MKREDATADPGGHVHRAGAAVRAQRGAEAGAVPQDERRADQEMERTRDTAGEGRGCTSERQKRFSFTHPYCQ